MDAQQYRAQRLKTLWLYIAMSAIFVFSILLFVINRHEKEPVIIDREGIMAFVRENAGTIVEDIKESDYMSTRNLLTTGPKALKVAGKNQPDIREQDGCVLFFCTAGNGPGSSTTGFCYAPGDDPPPEYQTEKICDHFWYFSLEN